ncbi:MAG: hypothetical protein M1829_004751 [Trizodia sp. TS-e1964]|nr:MAG: hypothetical protein M1829_004751 [Trizodia sp. TS-e1964]
MAAEDERAVDLAGKALEYLQLNRAEEAHRTLREAVSLSPQNSVVQAALSQLRDSEGTCALAKLCKLYTSEDDNDAGIQALQILKPGGSQLSDKDGIECLELLLDGEAKFKYTDELIALILTRSSGSRLRLASKLEQNVKPLLTKFRVIGKEATSGLVTTLLDPAAWASKSAQSSCEKAVFQCFAESLAADGDEAAISISLASLARLLVADSSELHSSLGEKAFNSVLSSLDYSLPSLIRSQATIITAKYLETSQEKGQKVLQNFIISHTSQPDDRNLALTFSVAASVFPILPSVAAELLLRDGFLPALIPLLKSSKSGKVSKAALNMLNAACVDQACREAIQENCFEWLQITANSNGQAENPGLAAVIIAKLKSGNVAVGKPEAENDKDTDQLVQKFKRMLNDGESTNIQSSIEGLAYTSIQPRIKENLANDKPVLERLISLLYSLPSKSPSTFGALNLISNLASYLPSLTEEQKRLSQLKAYANASKQKFETDPLETDDRVTARCKKLLEAGIVPLFVAISKEVSSAAQTIIFKVVLCLSKNQKHRGQLAQQGAVRLLLSAHGANELLGAEALRTASHALARILISVNPALVFGSSAATPISSAVRPLLSLLEADESAEQRDLLAIFESLLALTNLASTDDSTRKLILRMAWPKIQELLLANNTMIQRATVELVCNLMASPEGVAKFADGGLQASNRLHILLALADVDDYETRRAAGGALAMLTEWDQAVDAVVRRERGVSILLGLCQEEEEDLRHRGIACVRNIVCAPGAVGVSGVERVKSNGGVDVLKALLKASRNPAVLELCVEALKKLLG